MNTPKPQCLESNNKTVTTHRVHLDVIMCVSLLQFLTIIGPSYLHKILLGGGGKIKIAFMS